MSIDVEMKIETKSSEDVTVTVDGEYMRQLFVKLGIIPPDTDSREITLKVGSSQVDLMSPRWRFCWNTTTTSETDRVTPIPRIDELPEEYLLYCV